MSSRARLLSAVVLAAVALAAFPAAARADFINVISQTYHIDGSADAPHYVDPSNAFSFDQTSSTSPVSINHTVVFFAPGIDSGGVQFISRAEGAVTPQSASITAFNLVYTFGDNAAVSSYTFASLTFQPLEPQILVIPKSLEPNDTHGFGALYDETAGTTVLQFSVFPYYQVPFIKLPVDTTHVYTIAVSARAVGEADSRGGTLTVQAVPESESVLAFLAVGMVAIVATLGISFRDPRLRAQEESPICSASQTDC